MCDERQTSEQAIRDAQATLVRAIKDLSDLNPATFETQLPANGILGPVTRTIEETIETTRGRMRMHGERIAANTAEHTDDATIARMLSVANNLKMAAKMLNAQNRLEMIDSLAKLIEA